MSRKIIQIVVDARGVFALCNDGTVWSYQFIREEWQQLAGLPQ